MFPWAVFAVGTAVLTYVSRASLLAPRSHGFYRFFAWEFILALVLLNAGAWFREPFSRRQLVSWFLLAVSLLFLILGIRSLVTRGRPAKKREGDSRLIAFEKTTALVTTGIYGRIRHPLFSSLLFLAWGAFLKDPGWPAALSAAGATVSLYAAARVEEVECVRFFGPSYQMYMKDTKRFVPFLF